MRPTKVFAFLVSLAVLAGCSSPQDGVAKAQEQSYEAQEAVARPHLELVDKYQACVDESAGDTQRMEACDSYLRAAEALK